MSSLADKAQDAFAKVKDTIKGTAPAEGYHWAAIFTAPGAPVELVQRPTPTPGPNELLVEVKSIALNPLDWKQQASGFMIEHWPSVVGSDVAGNVLSVGSSVDNEDFKPGSRVFGFAPAFFAKGAPDYGALQTRVLIPKENLSPIPKNLSYNEASTFPMAVGTMWSALYTLDIGRDTAFSPSDKQGILIWGGASSIGTAGIQVASLLGFSVYTTASSKHHEYLKKLGATRTFDYKNANVEEEIINAAKQDGVTIQYGYDCVGSLESCLKVLKENRGQATAKLASAPPLGANSPTEEGVEVKFVLPPTDEAARKEYYGYIFNVWLKDKLEKGQVVPSPAVKVVDGGLEAVQKGLDELKAGVSGVKLVLEV